MHWETLDHPPYSPDLSPCDYFLFAPVKESLGLGGERFENNDEVEEYVRNWWQKFIECTGGCVEKN